MASSGDIGQMVVKIVGDNSSFDASIDSSGKKLEKFGTLATNVGKSLSLVLTAPIVAAGVAALKSAGQMQMYQASFETMLGSASKAKNMIADMQKLAAATPFELGDLAESGKMLLQYGITAENIMPMIRTLGDISQGSSAKLQTLSLAFGQMSSTGKLMGQDLLQMINAGFNPLFEISQKTGESMASLKDKMSKGQITVDMVTESFKRATSEGGKFFGGMEKASKTLPGLMSTLKDDVSTMGRSFVEDLMPEVMKSVKSLSSFAKMLTDLNGPTKAFIITMLGFAAAAGPVALGIGQISKALVFLSANPMVATVAGLTTITALLVAMGNAVEKSKLEKLADKYALVQQQTGLTLEELKKIQEAMQRQQNLNMDNFANSTSNARIQMQYLAGELGISIEDFVKIGLANEEITGVYREQLEVIQQQVFEENKLQNSANELKDEKKRMRDDESTATKKAIEDNKKEAEQRKILEDEQIAKRKEAASDYAKTISNNSKLEKAGLLDTKDLYKENYEATKKYAEQLVELGYNGQAVNGIMNLGNTALAAALESIRKYEIATANANDAIKNSNQSVQHGIEVIKEREESAAASAENEKKRAEEDAENKKFALNSVYSAAWEIAGAIAEINSIRAKKEIDEINKVRDVHIDALRKRQEAEEKILDDLQKQQLESLDAELQEELYKKGLASAETIAQYEEEVEAAKKTNDAKVIEEAQKALEEAQIKSSYAQKEKELEEKQEAEAIALKKKQDDEEAAIEKDASDRTRKLAYEANMATWRFNMANTIASGARAAIESFVNGGGWPWGAAAAAAMAGITTAQVAVLNENKPQLANGAVIMPSNGGTDVTVGEGGKIETVLPLDKLDSMLSNAARSNEGINDGGMIHLVQNLNGQAFLDMIFPATKNRTILLDHGAIV